MTSLARNSSPAWAVAYPRHHQACEHQIATQIYLAHQLSVLLRCRLLEPYRPSRQRMKARCYYVPDNTLCGAWRARIMGIEGEHHLYGGMVPRHFMATKAITHGLWRSDGRAPEGWVHELGARLECAVLAGYTTFDVEDARQAGRTLLQRGPLRLKALYANAGRGQRVARDVRELDAALKDTALTSQGLVLEENLQDLVTYSVGWCHVDGQAVAYVGTQELTQDNHGALVYGGSQLRCLRGGALELADWRLPPQQAKAVSLALHYDAAVSAAYPGLLASRRNYDVAIGRAADGGSRAGVLEQSWRAGGASVAELAALLFLLRHPEHQEVNAYTRERYGSNVEEPLKSDCVYRGRDATVGHITKTGGLVGEAYGSA